MRCEFTTNMQALLSPDRILLLYRALPLLPVPEVAVAQRHKQPELSIFLSLLFPTVPGLPNRSQWCDTGGRLASSLKDGCEKAEDLVSGRLTNK